MEDICENVWWYTYDQDSNGQYRIVFIRDSCIKGLDFCQKFRTYYEQAWAGFQVTLKFQENIKQFSEMILFLSKKTVCF